MEHQFALKVLELMEQSKMKSMERIK